MRVSRLISWCVRGFALLSLAAMQLVAQDAQQGQAQPLPEGPKPQQQQPATQSTEAPMKTLDLRSGSTDYSKSASILSIVGPYKPKLVPPPVLKNSPRIDQLMKDGKLLLSLG